ncbi:hypothetical protein [Streptomyces bikiniensis]|nr:hypothetical protein [Streptomyces bikiniensis]
MKLAEADEVLNAPESLIRRTDRTDREVDLLDRTDPRAGGFPATPGA